MAAQTFTIIQGATPAPIPNNPVPIQPPIAERRAEESSLCGRCGERLGRFWHRYYGAICSGCRDWLRAEENYLHSLEIWAGCFDW